MSNILVLGDSFASSEEGNPHFLELWGNKHNHNVKCIGIPGAGHVDIATQFIKKDLSNIDVAFYFCTDFWRASLSFDRTDFSFKAPEPKTYEQHFLYNFNRLNDFFFTKNPSPYSPYTLHNPGKQVRLNLLAHENLRPLDAKILKGFYTAIEPEWLFRANHFAMCNIFARLKKQNAKIIMVWPFSSIWGRKQSIIMVDDVDGLIKMKNISPGVEKKYVTVTCNHLGPEDAKETAELFEEYLQKTPDIKALLNK
jgi:hypothetical protein